VPISSNAEQNNKDGSPERTGRLTASERSGDGAIDLTLRIKRRYFDIHSSLWRAATRKLRVADVPG
jgi:hypothetical protein